MPTYRPEGAYRATGLPVDDAALFRAWQFLSAHREMQPPLYQNDFTQRLAQRLIDAGERHIAVTGGALLCMMMPEMGTPIARAVSADTAATAAEFSQHIRSRFAYFDLASPPVQKITLAYMTAIMDGLQKKGDAFLAALSEAALHGGAGKLELTLLIDPRAFLLAADKSQGTTGNARLENLFVDAALEYQAYYQSYLQQLLGSELLSAAAHAAVATRLQGQPPLPRLHETAIPVSELLVDVYAQICRDPRVTFEAAVEAIRLTEIIADAGETVPAPLAAALLYAALPHIGPTDEVFLEKLGAGEVVEILQDNRAARKQHLSLAHAPVSLQQMELAGVILTLRDGQQMIGQMQQHLDGQMQAAPVEHRQLFVAKTLTPLQATMQDIQNIVLADADNASCPALVTEARAQMRLLSHMITQISNHVRLSGPQPQPKPQRRPEPGGM